jgi:hypothetical protein
MRPAQLQLFSNAENRNRREHGGSIRKGKRKLARPISTKQPLHLVMRSSRAKGQWSFLHSRNRGVILGLVAETADRYGIRVDRFDNVGNHLHFVMQGKNRLLIRSFLKVLPQKIMFAVTGAKKGNPVGRFFDGIVYSRLVTWGREYEILRSYLWKNALEALGLDRVTIEEWRAAAKSVPL